jgi:hypothetical protein
MTQADKKNTGPDGRRQVEEPSLGKKRLNVAVFVVTISIIIFVILLLIEPESAGIRRELKKHAQTLDAARFSKDRAYQAAFQSEDEMLRFRLAHAYNGERDPDLAIPLLEGLIKERENLKGAPGTTAPDASSLSMEGYYWEELANAFRLKNEKEKMEKAFEARDRLRQEAKKAAAGETAGKNAASIQEKK